MRFLWILAALSLPCAAAKVGPLKVEVYRNRALDDASIISMSGLSLNPELSAEEVAQQLETSNLFSSVTVTRKGKYVSIFVREKTNWFAFPYFLGGSGSTIYGVAGGKSSVLGQNGNILGRFQFGTDDLEASLLLRDEYFLNSRWILGASFEYSDTQRRIYVDRTIVQRTDNTARGASVQTGFHLRPDVILGFDTFIESHSFEEPAGARLSGTQVSHRLSVDFGNLYVDEGLARGAVFRTSFEFPNPISDFKFFRMGAWGQISGYLRGDFNWIAKPRFEVGSNLPYYQLFEIGGTRLRSFAGGEFRDEAYASLQNDLLVTSFDFWKLRFRPMLYGDWAYVQGGHRMGLGVGMQTYFKHIAIPALQFFAGYGFNPEGWSLLATIGPQF
jgi:outer membrane protein assembly factor BamA